MQGWHWITQRPDNSLWLAVNLLISSLTQMRLATFLCMNTKMHIVYFIFFWTFDLLSLTLYFISQFHQDGQGYLEDLVRDMVSWLSSSSGLKPERCLQSNGLLTTLSQHYFLFLGTLSAHPQGVKLLEKCGLFQWWVYRKEIAYFQCVQGSLDKTLAAKCFLCCIIGMSVCMNGFLT